MNTIVLDGTSAGHDLFPFTLTRSVMDIRTGILTLREKQAYTNTPDAPVIRYPWDIFRYNDLAIRSDFELLTKGRVSGPIPPTVQAISPSSIFIEESARI